MKKKGILALGFRGFHLKSLGALPMGPWQGSMSGRKDVSEKAS